MDDRAHQFAARRAALNGEAAGRCEAGLDQPARAIDEIVEGVGAFFQLAVQIPAIAHVVAAPDVRDRIGEAPVQQGQAIGGKARWRSEEHTSELQSLMRISYAVFCLKKKKTYTN